MKPLRGSVLPTTCAVAILSSTAYAQEFFREFGTSRNFEGIGRISATTAAFEDNGPSVFSHIAPIDDSADEKRYNFRLGEADFILGAGIGVELNDNINLSDSHRLSDIIFRPQLDVEGLWRISENNRVRFGLGLSYAEYFDHNEFDSDSVLIAPNSGFAWTVQSGDFSITVRDRVSYQEDPFALPLLSGVATYPRWENQAGVQVDWDANEFTRISFGYDRYDLWTRDEQFESLDRGINTVYLRPSYQISPNLAVGVNMSASWVNFREDIQADALVYMIGPFLTWKCNDRTHVSVEVGYQRGEFDGSTEVALFDPVRGELRETGLRDGDDAGTVYAKIELWHRVAETFRHGLIASKTIEVGFGSNFYDLYHAEYRADWNVGQNTTLSPGLFYEFYQTSGAIGEEAHRMGATLGVQHSFSAHLTLGLDYRFLWKDSNVPEADYYQNLALLSLYYQF